MPKIMVPRKGKNNETKSECTSHWDQFYADSFIVSTMNWDAAINMRRKRRRKKKETNNILE